MAYHKVFLFLPLPPQSIYLALLYFTSLVSLPSLIFSCRITLISSVHIISAVYHKQNYFRPCSLKMAIFNDCRNAILISVWTKIHACHITRENSVEVYLKLSLFQIHFRTNTFEIPWCATLF